MSDAAYFRDFITALEREMSAAGQRVAFLRVSLKTGVATLPLRGGRRFEIWREHVVSAFDTPEEMAAAVYAEYLKERSGADDA
jgi:hypothetical protein